MCLFVSACMCVCACVECVETYMILVAAMSILSLSMHSSHDILASYVLLAQYRSLYDLYSCSVFRLFLAIVSQLCHIYAMDFASSFGLRCQALYRHEAFKLILSIYECLKGIHYLYLHEHVDCMHSLYLYQQVCRQQGVSRS